MLQPPGSQGNFGATGRFCINLGVWFQPLERAFKQMRRWDPGDDPEKLAPHECHFNLRIDDLVPKKREPWWPRQLVPQHDSWFDVGPEHDLEQLTESLVRVFETYVIPWFAERGSLEAVARASRPRRTSSARNYLPDEGPTLEARGLRHVAHPIDCSTLSREKYEGFRDALNGLLPHGPVFVHCAGNVKVTGMMTLYRVLERKEPLAQVKADLARLPSLEPKWYAFFEAMGVPTGA